MYIPLTSLFSPPAVRHTPVLLCDFTGFRTQAGYDRELHTLTKNQEKERQAAEKQWHKLGLQTLNCQEDAETAAK